jgi:hypothetical protein
MLRRPRRIIIDDSDCGPHLVIYMQPMEGSAVYPAAAIVELATAAPVPSIVSVADPAIVAASIASEPAPAASSPMHVYFQQFAGCQHGNMEPAPTTSPPDAPIMDLRSAVPPQGQLQFLDLECTHMPKDSDDSSGCTGADSGYVSQLGRVNARFRITPAGIEVAQVPSAVSFCFLPLTPVRI